MLYSSTTVDNSAITKESPRSRCPAKLSRAHATAVLHTMPSHKLPGVFRMNTEGTNNNVAVDAAHSEGTTTPEASSRGGQTLVKRVQDACTTDEPRTPTARADDERTARENRMDDSRSHTPAVAGGQEVRSDASGDGNDGQTPADAVTNMAGQGVLHTGDGGSNAKRNDIDDDSAREKECDQIQGGSGVVSGARDVGDDVDGHGGGSTSPDPSRVPSGQYMEASPDARGVAGLIDFAQVDIHDCEECMNALDECGKDVSKFHPCKTHLDELYEKTKAYGTHCLNPGHDAQHAKLSKKPGGGIKFNRFGALS